MRTRSTPALLASLLATFGALTLATAALAAETTLSTTLAGGNAEVPPGDPDGSGSATITIDDATNQVCYDISVSGIGDATMSHIHKAPAGQSGSIVVPLDTDGFSGSTKGCVTADDPAVVADILANPAGYYVNVHTADFPGGAVRGQLSASPPNTAMRAGSSSPATLLGLLLLGVAALWAAARLATRRA